jgi:hypothetical protein
MASRIPSSAREKASDERLALAIADAGQKRESARTAIREHEPAAHEEIESGANAGS